MYIPEAFRQDDAEAISAFVRGNPFATLITMDGELPWITHLPLYLSDGGEALLGHVAKSNRHWRLSGSRSVAVFHGPHAYVSASWYASAGAVPTWNYLAAHITGTLAVLDREETRKLLDRMVEVHEPDPRRFHANLEGQAREGLEKAIVGVRIDIEAREGKWKLSQNKDAETRRRLAAHLDGTGDANAARIARLMRGEAGDG